MPEPRKPRARRIRSRAAPPHADVAIVTLILERATGGMTIDETFSTRMETWAMLEWALEVCENHIKSPNADDGKDL